MSAHAAAKARELFDRFTVRSRCLLAARDKSFMDDALGRDGRFYGSATVGELLRLCDEYVRELRKEIERVNRELKGALVRCARHEEALTRQAAYIKKLEIGLSELISRVADLQREIG